MQCLPYDIEKSVANTTVFPIALYGFGVRKTIDSNHSIEKIVVKTTEIPIILTVARFESRLHTKNRKGLIASSDYFCLP